MMRPKFPSPPVGEGGARSRSEWEDEGSRRPLNLIRPSNRLAKPLIPPRLRRGPLLLPQGEKGFLSEPSP